MKLKDTCSLEEKLWPTKKKAETSLYDKGPHSHSYVFSNSHVWILELDHKEGWVLKNGCFWNVVLEKTLESPLDCKDIKPVNPKGNQTWIFIGRTDADAEAPILWPLDAKGQFIGKDWGQEEKRVKEEEMVGWHRWLNGREFEQTPEDSGGLGNLVWYSRGHKELDMTYWLNNNTTIFLSHKTWRY